MKQLNKNRIFVSTLVLLAIVGTLGIAAPVHAAPQSSSYPVLVTSSYWYSQNSTQLVSPGSNYTPLFVEFTAMGTFSYLNASLNLTYYGNSPFSYSYISGPNTHQRTYLNLSDVQAGQTLEVYQLVNISASAAQGVYEVELSVATNSTSQANFPVSVAVLGTPQLTLVNYFTNPPVIYQGEKFIQFTAVVSNTGAGPAKNLQFSLSSSGFSVLTGAYKVAYLPSGSVVNYTFLMDAHNVTGQSSLNFQMGQQTLSLPVYIHNYGTLQIKSSIPTLTPGSSKMLETFNITNTGNKTLMDVNVHLLSPSVVAIHVSSSNPLGALTADNFTLAELTPGQQITVTYLVDVSSSAQTISYPAQLVVQWHLNNTPEQFYKAYNFNEIVSPTVIQKFTSSFTFTPLNIGVLVLIIILIIALVAVSARSRKIRKKLQAQPVARETPPSLVHKEIPEKSGEERKN